MKKDVKVGPAGSLLLFAIWIVGLIEIVKWVIQGLF